MNSHARQISQGLSYPFMVSLAQDLMGITAEVSETQDCELPEGKSSVSGISPSVQYVRGGFEMSTEERALVSHLYFIMGACLSSE